jgi:hypothetical protein
MSETTTNAVEILHRRYGAPTRDVRDEIAREDAETESRHPKLCSVILNGHPVKVDVPSSHCLRQVAEDLLAEHGYNKPPYTQPLEDWQWIDHAGNVLTMDMHVGKVFDDQLVLTLRPGVGA